MLEELLSRLLQGYHVIPWVVVCRF